MPYRDTYQPMLVYFPKTWFLYEGWRRYGLISFDEVPSAKQLERSRATRRAIAAARDEAHVSECRLSFGGEVASMLRDERR